jgi:hypothetical protein
MSLNPRPMPSQRLGLLACLAFAALMTAAVGLFTPLLSRFESPEAGRITRDSELPPDRRAAHYEWKLNEPTLWTRLSAWSLYALHQASAWGLIAWGAARKRKEAAKGGPRFSGRLDPSGLAFFALTALFALLHLLQTQLFYDGLAQDTPVFSSQASVIVMLVLVLIMQNERRGLFFGKRIPMPKAAVAFIGKYHGYYIAWALIYTLWFHPMTGTLGHLAGFFYMFALLAQGSLMYTRLHLSLRWSAFLEGLVLLHGAAVAFFGQSSPLWSMFACGFGFVFVATQLWGLRLPKPLNAALAAFYLAAVGTLYSGALSPLGPLFSQRPAQVHQALWIPITLYGLVPAFLLLAAALAWLGGKLRPAKPE